MLQLSSSQVALHTYDIQSNSEFKKFQIIVYGSFEMGHII